jgi:transposase
MNYCGIDLASRASAVCIEDARGRVVAEFEVPTDEDGFRTRLAGLEPMRCVVEASPLAEWVARSLEQFGHEVVIIDPRRAKAVICTKKKTDRIDARNLAKMARTGWYTAVHRKTEQARLMRTLLKARAGLMQTATAQQQRVLGLLRAHGIKVVGARGGQFEDRVREVVQRKAPELEPILNPLLGLWRLARSETAAMAKQIRVMGRADPVCRLLMTTPGVGPLVAAAYVATIDDPKRFTQSDQVAGYVGLVPRVHQSGDTEYRGRVTKEGDKLLRWLLVEAASALLTRARRACALKRWGLQLAARKGMSKAKVAVARKLAVLLHRMWLTGEAFSWS